jgi:hypothetical protein
MLQNQGVLIEELNDGYSDDNGWGWLMVFIHPATTK